MSNKIMGNMIGCYSQIGKTFILTDDTGNEFTGVVTDNEVIFTATDNDVREGSVYASDGGVSIGTKNIPLYHTCQGSKLVTVGSALTIANVISNIDSYDYTKLQAMVCTFNSNISDSVSTEKVVIDDNVYNVMSTEVVSSVTKNHDEKIVELGVVNNTDSMMILRFFMYKEIK